MRHHYLRSEPSSSSAHWAIGKNIAGPNGVLIQIGDAKGRQARTSNAVADARAFAQQMRSVLEFADRMPISLSEDGETVNITIHREDGLEMAAAIEAITG